MHQNFLFIVFILLQMSVGISNTWQTYYENHNKNQTPSYAETIAFSQRLADASPHLHYTTFGLSHQGRELPLLIYNSNGFFTPEKVIQSGSKIVLIQAAIHAGEPVGKDAGLLLLRDIVIYNKHAEHLENLTLLFIPILNVDGHERFGPYNRINQNGPEQMGWRTNALNLNLNRDYLKADSKEIQALLKLWHQWQPHFFIDTHSTNGGDYQYTMTYAMDIFGQGFHKLTNWINQTYLTQVSEKMKSDNYPIFQYVTYRSWHDPRSGLVSGVSHPMYSNGYASELNRPGLLLETHMLKPYHMRVESTYLMIVHTLYILAKDNDLKDIIQQADQYTSSAEFRNKPFPLRFELIDEAVLTEFLGVEYTRKKSTLTGGNWFIYESDKPATYQIEWFNKNKPSVSVMLPDAYIIPVEFEDVISRLQFHNLQIQYLKKDTTLEVETYRFENVRLASVSNEGRQNANADAQLVKTHQYFSKGSAVVFMDQPAARLIAHALEPQAPGSLLYWGFFNAIFQRAEYFETYVMEQMARDMLAQDPALKIRFDEWIKNNPEIMGNQMAILNWFYIQTPYYDQRHNVYPVGRIMNKDILEDLL